MLWLWCCWQSAEQLCREVEVADAASMARLVRGVYCCGVAGNTPLVVVMCTLVWCWRGQASAGLGALRSPAVGNSNFFVVVVASVVLAVHAAPVVVESYGVTTVMCV